MEYSKKKFEGTIIEVSDYSKIVRIKGGNKKPEQIVKVLLDEISDEELGKLMFIERVCLSVDERE